MTPRRGNSQDPSRCAGGRGRPAAAVALAFLFVGGVTVFHVVHIMATPSWIPGDDFIFTRSTAAGEWVGFHEQVRTSDIRFYPLAFQEFNLLVGAGNAPHLYYALLLAKYLLTLGAVALTLRLMVRSHSGCGGGARSAARAPSRRALCVLAAVVLGAVYLLQPRMHVVFGHIIYPESMQMAWLALFVHFGYRGIRGGRAANYAASFLFGSLALYYKEPTFLLVLPVAAVPLLVRMRGLTSAQRAYALALLLSVGVWLGLYVFLVYARQNGIDYATQYANSPGRGPAFARLFLDPSTIYPLMAALGLYRAFAIARAVWRGRGRAIPTERLFVDALLFGGLLYIAAYAALRLADVRFLPPSNVFFVAVCFYYAAALLRRVRRPGFLRGRALVAVAAVAGLIWLSGRLAAQAVGFARLHDIRRTWAPALGVVARHPRCPVIYVYPDADAEAGDSESPLAPYPVSYTWACIRLQMPQGAEAPEPFYLDMEGELIETDMLPRSRVRVIRRLPAGEEYFLFVPRRVTDFAGTMRRRHGVDVVRISDFAFEDPFVRDIWVPRAFARRLGRAEDLPAEDPAPLGSGD